MITIHGAITAGAKIYFAESMEKLPDNLKEVQPTIVFGVPRVWEKIYDKVAAKLKEATGAKRKLVDFAMSAGFEYHTAINDGRTPPFAVRARYALPIALSTENSNHIGPWERKTVREWSGAHIAGSHRILYGPRHVTRSTAIEDQTHNVQLPG